MIISRTPFRVSFAGGGSDISSFYRQHDGCVLSTTIDKYVYIAVHPYFNKNKTQLKYSQTELVDDVREISHPILRQCLIDLNIHGIDINSIADIPSGTGLGSSSTFTVGLLHALYAYKEKFVSQKRLASEACEVEIEKLGEPIGKQDQYAAAFGGMNFITFRQNDKVEVEKLVIKKSTLEELQDSLLMFYTGEQRKTKEILVQQVASMSYKEKYDNVVKMTELAKLLKDSLLENRLDDFGRILHEGWLLKKSIADVISNDSINCYYDLALENGATGGKLLGAGGGGFLLFFCNKENQNRLRSALYKLEEFPFSFDYSGAKIIYVG